MPPHSAVFPVSFAPMMGYTDPFLRLWAKLSCPPLQLYTEMVPAMALTQRPAVVDRFLMGDPAGCLVQVGGSDPAVLAQAASVIASRGYAGVNLNVGCPSARVQAGAFGACLMKTPERVAACVQAMQKAVSIPVSVKTRIGVDEHRSLPFLFDLIQQIKDAGCRHIILHARPALLNLNPKANRSIPSLDYEKVYAVKKAFPELQIEINGGIADVPAVLQHLAQVDGVMIGRAFLSNFRLSQDLMRALLPEAERCTLPMTQKVEQYLFQAKSWVGPSGKLPQAVKRPFLMCLRAEPGVKALRTALQQTDSWQSLEKFLWRFAKYDSSQQQNPRDQQPSNCGQEPNF